MGSFKLRMHQNPFSFGALPRGPRWVSLRRSPRPRPRPPSRLAKGAPPPPFPSPRRLRRLDLAAIPLLLKEIYANVTHRSVRLHCDAYSRRDCEEVVSPNYCPRHSYDDRFMALRVIAVRIHAFAAGR